MKRQRVYAPAPVEEVKLTPTGRLHDYNALALRQCLYDNLKGWGPDVIGLVVGMAEPVKWELSFWYPLRRASFELEVDEFDSMESLERRIALLFPELEYRQFQVHGSLRPAMQWPLRDLGFAEGCSRTLIRHVCVAVEMEPQGLSMYWFPNMDNWGQTNDEFESIFTALGCSQLHHTGTTDPDRMTLVDWVSSVLPKVVLTQKPQNHPRFGTAVMSPLFEGSRLKIEWLLHLAPRRPAPLELFPQQSCNIYIDSLLYARLRVPRADH